MTSPWKAGEVACRTFAFFRIFGRYLSGFVVICISVDRAWAVLVPINDRDRETSKRAVVMVSLALVASIASSTPEVRTRAVFCKKNVNSRRNFKVGKFHVSS